MLRSCWLRAMLLATALFGSFAAHAAVPATSQVVGALTTAAGGAVSDGTYTLTFTLLDGEAGKPVWTEGPVDTKVQGGRFAWALGSKTPLTPEIINGQRWLQITVGTDPALPAIPLLSALQSMRAAVADNLQCSGCVKAEHLDPSVLQAYAKTADLAPFAKSVDLAAYAKKTDLLDYVQASALAAVAGTGSYKDLTDTPKYADVAVTGNYGDLTGQPTLPKLGATCGTGLVMRGLLADGAYDCVVAFDPAALPKDGLSTISNGLLTNQFTEVAASTKTPIDIPDAFPAGTSDAITVPDFGIAQALTVTLDITNSDISKLRVTLYDPKGVPYKLYDQGAKGTSLKGTWPNPNPLVAGDLSGWVGANPKGLWSITVADLDGAAGKTDGKINSWSIQVKILSSKKVAATGAFILPTGTQAPFACDASVFGAQYASPTDKALYICNGSSWYAIPIAALGTKDSPVVNCKDLLTKAPFTKSGVYWVDPDGAGQGDDAYQVYCDMTTDGGGWTLVWSNLRGGTGKQTTGMTWATATATAPLYFKGTPSENLETWQVYTGLKRWSQLGSAQVRYSWSPDYGQGITQSSRCNYNLAVGNYALNLSSCTQLVGSTTPGLVSYHNGRPFATVDNDTTGCVKQYSSTPWWYFSCWDGSINGGGDGGGSGYYNGAYWSGSATAWGAAGGTGAGNGWIFVR